MFDSTIAIMANYIPAVLSLGRTLTRQGRAHAQLVPYQAFRCGDGEYLIVGAFTDGFWRRLCEAVGLESLLSDPRFVTNADRIANREVLIPILEKVFLAQPRQKWLGMLEAVDVPATPVFTLAEALASEQARANATIAELPGTEPRLFTVDLPARSSEWPQTPRRKPPSMGADTTDILEGLLGLNGIEIAALVADGVVGLER
jgi:crotonobetainyl-CoA:carnitine CoA-transferase CaiB-like acyl-CoA transferase